MLVPRRPARARTVLCFGLLLGGACLREDPDHCANLEGDAACSGLAPYCSTCEASANGCVSEPPPAACGPGEPGTETGTETGAPTCTQSGEDPSCPPEAPYCVEGGCESCSPGLDPVCAALDPGQAVCVAGWLRCAECSEDSECGAQAWCNDAFTCGGCERHDQCADACDFTEESCHRGTTLWVDNRSAPCPESGGIGTETAPYCDLTRAFEAVPVGGNVLIKLIGDGAPYTDSPTLTANRRVTIVGIDQPRIASSDGITVDRATLNIAGVELLAGAAGLGLVCENGSMRLDRVTVRGATGMAVAARECELVVEDSAVLPSGGIGLSLVDASRARVRNTAISDDTAGPANPAILVEASDLELVYSSVVHGNTALRCTDAATVELRNAVVGSTGGNGIECPKLAASYSVIDSAAIDGLGVVTVEAVSPTWFVNAPTDLRVATLAEHPLAQVALWAPGDPRVDRDGHTRPFPPSTGYAGVDTP